MTTTRYLEKENKTKNKRRGRNTRGERNCNRDFVVGKEKSENI